MGENCRKITLFDSIGIPNSSINWLFIFVLMTGMMLRLPFISYPSQVVFDEVGFGKLVNAYGWTGDRLFDIHPPLGKLLITATAYLGGYSGGIDFSKIGNPCSESIGPLRFLPGLAGSLIPAIVFLLLCQLGASRPAAFLGGMAMAFENAFVVQSRLIGLDTLLVLFIFSSLCALMAARKRSWKSRIVFMAFSGLLSGMAIGTKFTGLVAAGLGLVIIGEDLLKEKNARFRWIQIGNMAIFIVAAAGIYLLGWMIHFHLMIFPGEGDAFYVPTGHFFIDTFKLHEIMLSANAGITTPHPYSSYWWQWLIMKKPIFYWVDNNSGIYFIGNPVVWWGALLLFYWLLGYLIFARSRNLSQTLSVDRSPLLWIPLAGYLISIIPIVPIHRPLFLYHYLTALTFSAVSGILWVDILGFTRADDMLRQRLTYYIALGICVAVFGLLFPITYGVPPLGPYQTFLGWIGFGP